MADIETELETLFAELKKSKKETPSAQEYEQELENYAIKLLDYSEQDFLAAKLLHKNKNFAVSAYHLQQGVEKISKIFFLIQANPKTKENMDKFKRMLSGEIGHKTPLAFLLTLQGTTLGNVTEKLLDEKGLTKFVGKSQTSFFDLEGMKIHLENNAENYARISEEAIKGILMLIEALSAGIIPLEAFGIEELTKGAEKALVPEGKKVDLRKHDEFLRLSVKLFLLAGTFGVMTYPHAVYPRYPSGVGISLEEYQKGELGIIKTLPDILEAFKDVKDDFLFFFKKSNEIAKKIKKEIG